MRIIGRCLFDVVTAQPSSGYGSAEKWSCLSVVKRCGKSIPTTILLPMFLVGCMMLEWDPQEDEYAFLKRLEQDRTCCVSSDVVCPPEPVDEFGYGKAVRRFQDGMNLARLLSGHVVLNLWGYERQGSLMERAYEDGIFFGLESRLNDGDGQRLRELFHQRNRIIDWCESRRFASREVTVKPLARLDGDFLKNGERKVVSKIVHGTTAPVDRLETYRDLWTWYCSGWHNGRRMVEEEGKSPICMVPSMLTPVLSANPRKRAYTFGWYAGARDCLASLREWEFQVASCSASGYTYHLERLKEHESKLQETLCMTNVPFAQQKRHVAQGVRIYRVSEEVSSDGRTASGLFALVNLAGDAVVIRQTSSGDVGCSIVSSEMSCPGTSVTQGRRAAGWDKGIVVKPGEILIFSTDLPSRDGTQCLRVPFWKQTANDEMLYIVMTSF